VEINNPSGWRSRNYLDQIKKGSLFKAIGVAASFIAMPIAIEYLGQEMFGVWTTLLSVISWAIFLDFGIGIGLRNKVAEGIANNNNEYIIKYISTSYTLIGIIVTSIYLIILIIAFNISWQEIFNTRNIPEIALRNSVLIVAAFILLNFLIGLIGSILGGMQKTAIVALNQMAVNIILIIFLCTLIKISNPSIIYISWIYGIGTVIPNLAISLWFFNKNPKYLPKISIHRKYVKSILSIGIQFLIIQIAVLVIFTTDKLIIIQLFGPDYVTNYEIVFKLFASLTLIHSMILMPLWSAYTDAYHRHDLSWIKAMLGKQLVIFIFLVILTLLLIIFAKKIIIWWIGDNIKTDSYLVICMGIYVVISMWNNVFAFFINGIGKIKIQMYTAIIAMAINIPLSIYFGKNLGYGVSGVIMATTVSLSIAAIVLPIQTYFILKDR